MWNKFHKYGFALLIFTVSVSCGRTPDGVLSEKKMKEVTIDMKLAEAMVETDHNAYGDNSSKEALYQSVFDKHKITEAVYDSSLIWYGENLEIYMELLEQAGDEVSRRIKEMGDIRPEIETPVSQKDSVDIWPLRKFYVFSSASPNLVVFNLKPGAPYPAGSVFVLGADFCGISSRLGRMPELKITVEQSDTTMTVYKSITRDGYSETEIKTLPTQQVRRVYGYIRMFSNHPSDARIYVDRLNLFKYNFGGNRTHSEPAELTP